MQTLLIYNMRDFKMKSFFKKEARPDFNLMLGEQCRITSQCAGYFLSLTSERNACIADKIESCEKQADQVRKNLINYVETSFITPLDRHDIFAVSRSIDDITDKLKDLKDFLMFFNYQPTDEQQEMAHIIQQSISNIEAAVSEWSRQDKCNFWEYLVKTKKNENEIKRMFWKTIYDLDDEAVITKDIIILREFSRDLNDLANKTGKTADKLSDMKIKSIK